jgi:hypothetical protein
MSTGCQTRASGFRWDKIVPPCSLNRRNLVPFLFLHNVYMILSYLFLFLFNHGSEDMLQVVCHLPCRVAGPDHGLVIAIALVVFHIPEQLLTGRVRKVLERSNHGRCDFAAVCLHAQPYHQRQTTCFHFLRLLDPRATSCATNQRGLSSYNFGRYSLAFIWIVCNNSVPSSMVLINKPT